MRGSVSLRYKRLNLFLTLFYWGLFDLMFDLKGKCLNKCLERILEDSIQQSCFLYIMYHTNGLHFSLLFAINSEISNLLSKSKPKHHRVSGCKGTLHAQMWERKKLINSQLGSVKRLFLFHGVFSVQYLRCSKIYHCA